MTKKYQDKYYMCVYDLLQKILLKDKWHLNSYEKTNKELFCTELLCAKCFNRL